MEGWEGIAIVLLSLTGWMDGWMGVPTYTQAAWEGLLDCWPAGKA